MTITYGDVRESIAVARSHGEKFFEQIVWQVENEAWTILGHPSWDAMRAVEYADMGVVAPRADRPELVSRLRAKGLTQKEIAGTLGVHESTVSRELADASSDPGTITNARGQERPARYAKPDHIDLVTGEVLTEIAEPMIIPGDNGKQYTRPEPKPQRRRSLVDAAQDAAADLLRAAEKVERIYSDDRYPKNREQVAEVTRGYLSRTVEVIDRINSL